MRFLLYLDLEIIQCMLRIQVNLIFGKLLIIRFQQTVTFMNPYDGACGTLKKLDYFYIKCIFPIFGLRKKFSKSKN